MKLIVIHVFLTAHPGSEPSACVSRDKVGAREDLLRHDFQQCIGEMPSASRGLYSGVLSLESMETKTDGTHSRAYCEEKQGHRPARHRSLWREVSRAIGKVAGEVGLTQEGLNMALIKLRKANQNGDEIGPVFVNTDQVVSVGAGAKATEISLANGGTQWVKETPDEVVTKAKTDS